MPFNCKLIGRRSKRDWEISNLAEDEDGHICKMSRLEDYARSSDASFGNNNAATLPPLFEDVTFNYPAIITQLVNQQQQKSHIEA